jgi:16S rRNA (cytidine1402-2'-O)-methyltransferase
VTRPDRRRLRVVGTPIGNLSDLSPRASAALAGADVIACEDTRRTGRLLSLAGIAHRRLVVVNEHTERSATPSLVAAALGGESVVLVSDAGLPAISDPGHLLVTAAIEAGLEVEVVPGPSAVLVALVASGLASDRFCFEGFLPRKGAERARRLGALATEARTSVIFEAPHRIARTLADLRDAVGPDRPVAVARELTKLYEEVWRTTLGDAAAVAAAGEPRGEHVVVLGGAPQVEVGDDEVSAALRARLDAGATRRDAVDAVVAELGVARKRAYSLALELS